MNHPAVLKHGKGLSSADLASFVEAMSSLSQSRIKGIGADQYEDGGSQQFEGMSEQELIEYFLEEMADGINYLAMLSIKVLAVMRAASRG